ncbi:MULTISPECIES: SDR family NAD(P)-dependent oxidoreductase [Chryseobacterium]|uniref:Decaprenylphospho-beta-D-erythro-pentofuranosid-2-ulose 2-reductase n=1 Tax=Chryseobacterium camelliae TaxID=1265445 RepID=A0ABU0TL48_9FLAO|nr:MULTISPECIES: SDR family NAD(P)-dependent oxidoreductase [Chryseobacterium]MDQ1097768.1 decaprenylphospho-beta-D-erythro-pentofuranosid-2-ulose 2-reductase [Chryseobacterium camelliae]MDR6085140.1 decaprenylphospho-beta-D-erythro-pentofuranosid-2-ulose 2-reductase [Chryseobacterium sp. SORGH_AS_0909]MDR6129499.1 decaprenylphospho-beta-D-erythro-pentofuranosid-2-ulose 2-reductase [Chryseobacterium sp. SORGH_AS_1175]
MEQNKAKNVLILGANSDVAKQCMKQYVQKGFSVMAASRDTGSLEHFVQENKLHSKVTVLSFDAVDFAAHQNFYAALPAKPHIVVYAAGFLVDNASALEDFEGAQQMMMVNYMGAVSILNIVAMDKENKNLERIIGLSSLSGVRGRKSNFVYGSTKAAFTTYLAGLRQELASRNITVNALVIGYIRTKINAGLQLNESLIMEPDYVARYIVNAGNSFTIVPNFKWKIIYLILKILPESLVAKLP